MGNQTLVAALQSMAGSTASPFREVVMAAPDIDAGIFEQAVGAISGTAHHITLYASKNDEALKISKRFAQYPRAGDASDGIIVLPGIDSIDASIVDTSFLGHSYYGSRAGSV
jgi:esterase/lipase superfamily enzyme